MKKSKEFKGGTPVQVTTHRIPDDEDGIIIHLGEENNNTTTRTIDLTDWLGRGIDSWVWALASQLRALIAGKSVSKATVSSYWNTGFRYFFEFLLLSKISCQPDTLEKQHILAFIVWIKDHEGWSRGVQKNICAFTKSLLVAMQQRGIIPISQENLFPANPFPRSNQQVVKAVPYSTAERERLAAALRDEIVAYHHGNLDIPMGQAMTVLLLAVSIRLGCGPTEILTARRDLLKPHPFMPNLMLAELFKTRGNATKIKQLRFSREEDRPTPVDMSGVALLKEALRLSAPLVVEAPKHAQDRIWLYRDSRSISSGKVTALTPRLLLRNTSIFVDRHNLCGDDGKPLVLNLRRLRKTMEMRLWALSGGDILVVSSLMGHTPQVAENHYLACTDEMRKDATFVGEALPDIYRNGGKIIPIKLENSPVGRCKDPWNGERAPKDGDPCDDFFSCFSCSSYAIVGCPEDLHRLFSFYWFLEVELNHARSPDWREQFRHTMGLIDRFTLDKFNNAMVLAAKERAKCDPIKFWKSYTLSHLTGTDHG